MTKKPKKLAVRAETIIHLSEDRLGRVAGGSVARTQDCFIMKDTIIIKTGGIVARP